MPVKFRVVLIPEESLPAGELYPDKLHALFFSLAGEDLARELHKPSKVKPFSLGFFCESREGRKRIHACADTEEVSKLVLEISFLRDELFPKFLASFMLGSSEGLRLGEVKLRKVRRPLIRENDIVSYEGMLGSASPVERITMNFLSPTTFRKGNSDYPLPDPKLVFKGLVRKWHLLGDLGIDVDLRDALERVKVAGAWIGTERVHFSGMGFLTGFVGRVIFSFDDLREEERVWMSALARFAQFAGVGRKTTMGLGGVKVSEEQLS